jgi:PTH2 family peptidyl-tRNA hydrolase
VGYLIQDFLTVVARLNVCLVGLAVAVGLVSATIGYWVGVGSNLRFTNATPQYTPASSEKGENAEGEESDGEGYADGNLGDVKAGMMEACKLVSTPRLIIVRIHLHLSIGPCGEDRPWDVFRKDCCAVRVSLFSNPSSSQVETKYIRHATLACYKALSTANPALLRHWEQIGQAKIALKCNSEEELLLLQATAQSLNLCARSIQDA